MTYEEHLKHGNNTPGYTSIQTIDHAEHIAETFTPPRTPTANTSSAHNLFAEIQSIYTTLSSLPNLAPGEEINTLLTHLVQLCIEPHSASFASAFFAIKHVSVLCQNLRPICAIAEGELEKYWAQRICQEAMQNASHGHEISGQVNASHAPRASELLKLFPYHQNYIDLSRLEASAISAYLPAPPTHFAFVGSGPLPLTSLCMLDRYPNARVHNIDRDEDALRVSQELCEKLEYDGMSFGLEDVTSLEESGTEWQSFQVVFLAALVGMNTESKMEILASLARKMRAGALVVARSARGLRSVLYPVGHGTS